MNTSLSEYFLAIEYNRSIKRRMTLDFAAQPEICPNTYQVNMVCVAWNMRIGRKRPIS
jgi:hypothetical protein